MFAKPQTLGRQQGSQIDIVYARLRAAAQEDGSTASRLLLRRFRFGPGERYRTAAERLARLDLSAVKSRTAIAITALCNEAFDKEALTNEFFKKLDQHIKAIESDLREHQHLGDREAFSQAQLLIERMIFLYFAQNRGWLNQEPDYLIKNFSEYRNDARGFGYYEEFLHRLFHSFAEQDFGNRLPGVPFLNGGLFDDDEFKLPLSKLKIRNATFANLFDDLLEAYNFTVREDTPLSQEVAVDPEMLGKIFESIVLHAEAAGEEYQAPDKRKATGSYYTPRIVVHFICRENLRLYFVNRAEVLSDPACRTTWGERISRLFKEIDPTDGFSEEELRILKTLLSPEEGKRCLQLLLTMRTLDPAVGSGAFPVGLLHELTSLQRVFETAVNGYVDPVKGSGSQWMQKAKEYFIQNSLFGVDIQQQAIEICRLRLWLSLLVDYELGVNPFEAEPATFIAAIKRISQLPNLEMNFKRGDSLHDYICGHPVRIEPQKPSQYATELDNIEKLGAKLHKSVRGETKRKLRLEILERRIALAQRIITDEIKSLSDQSFNLAADWFGAGLSDREKSKRLDEEIARLQTARKQLERDEINLRKLKQQSALKASDFYRKLRELEGSEMDGPLNFAWRIDFPHVLNAASTETLRGEFSLVNQAQRQQDLVVSQPGKSDSGFDLIVGNPPFVTARNKIKRELYRERWPRVCFGTYPLVCPFFEMSFGVLKDEAQLGFIVSNAFAKREFGRPLVEDFFPTVDLQKIVDCSGLLFPGHGTPTCLLFARNAKPETQSTIRVTAIIPGGGDLLAVPEESQLWDSIAQFNDQSGYQDSRITVADRSRAEMSKWPLNFDSGAEPTRQLIEKSPARLLDFLTTSIGYVCITKGDELFFQPQNLARRLSPGGSYILPLTAGDDVRNWSAQSDKALFPYNPKTFEPAKLKDLPYADFFQSLKTPLSDRITFGKPQAERGLWYEYAMMTPDRVNRPFIITMPEIATHNHALVLQQPFLASQTAPVASPSSSSLGDHQLIAALMNSSTALFWLKQVCFNKGAGEDEHRDRFVYAGGKVEQLPVTSRIAEALRSKGNALSDALIELSEACWQSGSELQSLALRKLFEKRSEAYHAWSAALPGYIEPHKDLSASFSTTNDLEKNFSRAQEIRERLRAQMIARQEEMDWLVYTAYGLIDDKDPAAQVETEPAPLDEAQRVFRLWQAANGDFARAVKSIPADWAKSRRMLWEMRLAAIRDNEHIRRIEQPVYKRRWDEQWKVGNRWTCGPAAYAQELVDAFTWWLSEKAEWHLEHKAKGGPIALPDWSAALFKDTRIAAAWEVVADAIFTVEKFKFDALDEEEKETRRKPKADDSYTAFERFFRDTVLDQSVAHGIPRAVPWNELAAKKKWTPMQLKKAQAVRGKLNVPRERFQQMSPTYFVWAGHAS
jgi:type I restriction-modification system DNA methylase subunit